MKLPYIAIFLWACFSLSLSAQDYVLDVKQEPFITLANGSRLNPGVWDDERFSLPIGFPFEFMGVTYDSILVDCNGGVLFYLDDKFTDTLAVFSAFGLFEKGADLLDRGDTSGISISPISYDLSGVAGEQILKIEWRNAGFFDEYSLYGTLNDSVSVQLWMHEKGNKIESRIGPNAVSRGAFFSAEGPVIGMGHVDTLFYEFSNGFYLTGPSQSPYVIPPFTALDDSPREGSVFSFSPKTTTTSTLQENEYFHINVYPVPAQDYIHVEFDPEQGKDFTLELTDMYGKTLKNYGKVEALQGHITIPVLDLPTGLYNLRFLGDKGLFTRKVLIE
ncbi:MAG: T9SS type A sorting domain-containing protein [Bacteroidota bacterium]